jgi:hypothetical protein
MVREAESFETQENAADFGSIPRTFGYAPSWISMTRPFKFCSMAGRSKR